MINLKSKQVKRTKRFNNELNYICEDCSFNFTIYNKLLHDPYCPKCGDNLASVKIDAPLLTARENYKTWTKEEMDVIQQVVDGKIRAYQGALLLDRTISSVKSKVSRVKKMGGNADV